MRKTSGPASSSVDFVPKDRFLHQSDDFRALAQRTVKWFSKKKGYGFISQEDGPDIFVHYSTINIPGFKTIAEGDRVSFELEENDRGLVAKNVIKV